MNRCSFSIFGISQKKNYGSKSIKFVIISSILSIVYEAFLTGKISLLVHKVLCFVSGDDFVVGKLHLISSKSLWITFRRFTCRNQRKETK